MAQAHGSAGSWCHLDRGRGRATHVPLHHVASSADRACSPVPASQAGEAQAAAPIQRWPQWIKMRAVPAARRASSTRCDGVSVCARSVGALEFLEVHVVRSLLRFAPRLLEVGVLGYFVEDTGPLRAKAQALRHGIRREAGGCAFWKNRAHTPRPCRPTARSCR